MTSVTMEAQDRFTVNIHNCTKEQFDHFVKAFHLRATRLTERDGKPFVVAETKVGNVTIVLYC